MLHQFNAEDEQRDYQEALEHANGAGSLAVADRQEMIDALQAKVKNLMEMVFARDNQISDLMSRHQDLVSRLGASERFAQDAIDQSDKDVWISTMLIHAVQQDAETVVENLQQQLKTRNTEYQSLHEVLQEAEEKLQAKEATVAQQKSRIAALEQQLEERLQRLEDAQRAAKGYSTKADEAEAKVAELESELQRYRDHFGNDEQLDADVSDIMEEEGDA